MLTIRYTQLDDLSRTADAAFAEGLRLHLADRHPALLPRFPEPQQRRIVETMIARARRCGATWESSIALFCDLMEAVAPDFHRSPAIAAAIGPADRRTDERIEALPDTVEPAAWDHAERNRCDLDLYAHPDLDGAPPGDRIAAALDILLWDHAAARDALASGAMTAAERFGFAALPDAPLALAAWRALYGAGTRLAWMDDIVDPAVPPGVRLAALRLRIMIDHGRRV